MTFAEEITLEEHHFLVSETDCNGVIMFANEDFCKIGEYDINELIGKNHNIVRHHDMPKEVFRDLWTTIQSGNTWEGYVKNKTKTGKYYWTHAVIYPFQAYDGSRRYLSCRRKATTTAINEHEKIYKTMREAKHIVLNMADLVPQNNYYVI